jgi:hypothetical protein
VSQELLRARCLHHARREAAARCPSCAQDFCRECVVEHQGRLLCTSCLEELLAAGTHARRHLMRRLARAAGTLIGLFLAWVLFFLLGDLLTRLPSPTHPVAVEREP